MLPQHMCCHTDFLRKIKLRHFFLENSELQRYLGKLWWSYFVHNTQSPLLSTFGFTEVWQEHFSSLFWRKVLFFQSTCDNACALAADINVPNMDCWLASSFKMPELVQMILSLMCIKRFLVHKYFATTKKRTTGMLREKARVWDATSHNHLISLSGGWGVVNHGQKTISRGVCVTPIKKKHL